jgi:hypothetical protein
MSRRLARSGAFLAASCSALLACMSATADTKRPNPPAQVCIGTNCVSTPTGAGSIKWNPGHYMAANTVIFAGNTISRIQGEMDDLKNWDKILGYRVFITWGALEPQMGQYDFSVLDAIMTRLKTAYPKPKRMVLVVLPGTFAQKHSSNNGGSIPMYLQTDSKYGPSPTSGSYGWWGLNQDGVSNGLYSAALYRPAVMDRFIALNNALGAHFDGEPNFEGYMIQENSWMVQGWAGAPDYKTDLVIPQFKRMLTAATAAFPHTSVIMQNTWFTTAQPTVDFEQWMVTNRIAPGAADVYGQTGLTTENITGRLSWGLLAYAGVKVAGTTQNTDLRNQSRAMLDVEAPDICGPRPIRGGPYTPLDIVNALNQTYKASHAFWTHLYGTEKGCPVEAKWSNLAATITANPLTNISYPPNYP